MIDARCRSQDGGVNFKSLDVKRAPVTNSLPACKVTDLTCQPSFFQRFKEFESVRSFVSSSKNRKAWVGVQKIGTLRNVNFEGRNQRVWNEIQNNGAIFCLRHVHIAGDTWYIVISHTTFIGSNVVGVNLRRYKITNELNQPLQKCSSSNTQVTTKFLRHRQQCVSLRSRPRILFCEHRRYIPLCSSEFLSSHQLSNDWLRAARVRHVSSWKGAWRDHVWHGELQDVSASQICHHASSKAIPQSSQITSRANPQFIALSTPSDRIATSLLIRTFSLQLAKTKFTWPTRGPTGQGSKTHQNVQQLWFCHGSMVDQPLSAAPRQEKRTCRAIAGISTSPYSLGDAKKNGIVLGFFLDFQPCPFSMLSAAIWSWKLPFQRYLQRFWVRTSHFPWYLQHFGAQTVHATC